MDNFPPTSCVTTSNVIIDWLFNKSTCKVIKIMMIIIMMMLMMMKKVMMRVINDYDDDDN